MRATLTDQNILDMLDTAGYGIAYWASRATVDQEARTYTVWWRDDPDEELIEDVATFDDIENAFNALLANDRPRLVGDWLQKYFLYAYADRDVHGIDAGHIDGEAADALVQIALWGKVVFG